MANEVPTFVQLPQEDLQKLLDEVAVLRQEVLILRQEKEEHHQYLAISDARIHVLEEGQKVTDVSPPNSPHLAHPEQAEPSIELEEVVESAPEPPFKEVRGRYRKRRTSPFTPQVQTIKSGSSREPPSAEAPKKAKHRNPPAPQAQPPRPAPAKPVAQQKTPAESKIPPIIIRDGSKWPSISSGMQARRIAAKPCVDGILVNPGTSDDFRALTLLLEGQKENPPGNPTKPSEKSHSIEKRTSPPSKNSCWMMHGNSMRKRLYTRTTRARIRQLRRECPYAAQAAKMSAPPTGLRLLHLQSSDKISPDFVPEQSQVLEQKLMHHH
jgi:pyruvate/2-oxoglutarate dehydrogenase complex dihydrolipoamide acyltransferase (E2) component